MVLVVKNPPANAGDIRDVGSIPGLGKSTGGEHSNPLQYSSLENPMDRGACRATVHRVIFKTARTWKQPRCPSTDEWIKKSWYIYTMKYYSAIKRTPLSQF